MLRARDASRAGWHQTSPNPPPPIPLPLIPPTPQFPPLLGSVSPPNPPPAPPRRLQPRCVPPQADTKSCEDLAEDDRYSAPPDGSSSPLDEDIATPTASLFIDSLTTEGGTLWGPRAEVGVAALWVGAGGGAAGL